MRNTLDRNIGFWARANGAHGQLADVVAEWAQAKALDGAVWTAPKWGGEEGLVPTIDEVLKFLRRQGGASEAADYVRTTPGQITTPYRQRIEVELGWTDINP